MQHWDPLFKDQNFPLFLLHFFFFLIFVKVDLQISIIISYSFVLIVPWRFLVVFFEVFLTLWEVQILWNNLLVEEISCHGMNSSETQKLILVYITSTITTRTCHFTFSMIFSSTFFHKNFYGALLEIILSLSKLQTTYFRDAFSIT